MIFRSVSMAVIATTAALWLTLPASAAVPAKASPTRAVSSQATDGAKSPSLTPAQIVARADAWFNSAVTMECDFVQIGPDGRRTKGRLYVQRPGRLRFEYASPATLQIIADGTSVAIRDRKLATQDVYFIWQTPLKFLLDDPIDLNRDTKVVAVQSDPQSVSIFLEDKTTFEGTSHIRLFFDPKTFALKQWTIIDPQGYQTLVSLFHMNLKAKPDPRLFHISTTEHDDQ